MGSATNELLVYMVYTVERGFLDENNYEDAGDENPDPEESSKIDKHNTRAAQQILTFLNRVVTFLQEGKPKRNDREKGLASSRDGVACVILGTIDPDVAHILPFATTQSHEAAMQLKAYWHATAFIVSRDFHLWKSRHVIKDGFDKSFNMNCLEAQMHRWWGKAYWALQSLGQPTAMTVDGGDTKWVVRMKFYWLPNLYNSYRYPETANLDGSDNTFTRLCNDLNQAFAHGFPARTPSGNAVRDNVRANLATGELLLGGHLFSVAFDTQQEAFNYNDMIKLEWAVLRIEMFRAGW
ncbi:hypothetical protein FVEN_g12766 [Fusarium venenatum]|nr:hypothetical protein FVEN_g12766 [Fusarium venenatum]